MTAGPDCDTSGGISEAVVFVLIVLGFAGFNIWLLMEAFTQ